MVESPARATLSSEQGGECSFDSTAVEWTRPNPLQRQLRIVSLCGLAFFAFGVGTRALTFLGLGALLVAGIAGLLMVVVPQALGVGPKRARLRRTQAGLEVNFGESSLQLAASQIVTGWFEVPRSFRLALEDGHTVSADLGETDAKQLLEALHLVLAPSVTRLRVYSRLARVPAGELCCVVALLFLGLLWMVATAHASAAFWALFSRSIGAAAFTRLFLAAIVSAALFGIAVAIVRQMRPREVAIGDDGFVIEGPGRRVVAFRNVTMIHAFEGGVTVQFGEVHAMKLFTRRFDPIFDPRPGLTPGTPREAHVNVEASALASKLRHAQEQCRTENDGRTWARLLDRNGQSGESWRKALFRVSAEPGDYRRRFIPEKVLVELASDAQAPPDRRAAAAFLLARSDRAGSVKATLEACADRKLARVLEKALDQNLDERVIERLERQHYSG